MVLEGRTVPAVQLVLEVLVAPVAQQVLADLEVHGRQDIRCFQQVQLDPEDRQVQENLQTRYFLVFPARREVPVVLVVRSCPETLSDLVVQSDLTIHT